MNKVVIEKAKSKVNKYGARKYAFFPSESDTSRLYEVAKLRKRDGKHYKYVCNCPSFVNRQKKCKHIKAFILAENNMGIKGIL